MSTATWAEVTELATDTGVLVERARNGDESAWNSLVTQYTPVLWRTARSYRLNHADAADAVQLTWLRCVQHLDRIRNPQLLLAWLLTTCHRESLRIIRRDDRAIPMDASDPASPFGRMPDTSVDADPAQTTLARERDAILNDAIARLPERQQRVLSSLLQAGGEPGMGYAEIAAALEMPQGSLGPTRQRAFRRLRQDASLCSLAGAPRSR